MILFVYDFCVHPERLVHFQEWAATKGMKFWEKQLGVIRYQTFRKDVKTLCSGCKQHLLGQAKSIDVLSEVVIQDTSSLEAILRSEEFQAIQNELLQFIDQNSLSYSVLNKAYDSLHSQSG